MLNYAYKYTGGVLTSPPLTLPIPYFNNKPEYAGFVSAWDPYSKTHTSRLWMTDLNQDGLPDILAGQEIWGSAGLQRSVFQILINRGGMVFSDQTDTLQPEYVKTSNTIDYSVRLVDVDSSGIDSMFLVGTGASTPSLSTVHGNYLLVNDGTGRLYAVLHDQFRGMATKLITYAQAQLPSTKFASPGSVPSFYPYRTKDGLINYVAMLSTGLYSDFSFTGYMFVNVPLGINLTTDFRRDLTVATRNGSKNIRTFAGNDTIFRALSDPDCRIDGGLGTNTVVYPGKRSDWVLSRVGTQFTARPTAPASGGTDTLTRIQKARFDDQTVDLASLP